MIIKHPTGLFKTALPSETGSGNVIFTISNNDPSKNDPPRSPTVTLQIPAASVLGGRVSSLTDDDRRLAMGELIFTITSGVRYDPGSGKKAFEVGEYLEFTDEEEEVIAKPNIPDSVEIQHNTNILDTAASGLDDTQISTLIARATELFNSLKQQLATAQSNLGNTKVRISENQKAINEQNKLIDVTKIVMGETDPMCQQLQDQLDALIAEKNSLIANQNAQAEEAKSIYDQMIKVSMVIK